MDLERFVDRNEQASGVEVATDVVIFSLRDGGLKLLLVKRGGEAGDRWALPGGFVKPDEDIGASAKRALEAQTGVSGVYLEQLYTFGKPDRQPAKRVISVAHYALIPSDRLEIRAADSAHAVAWFAVDDLPELAFDHREIVDLARRRVTAKLDYSTIALQFLSEKFSLSELQGVYEAILGDPLDKRNFRKRMTNLGIIEATGDCRRGPNRPAKLYRAKHPGEVNFIK